MSASSDQQADSSWLRPALVASWEEFGMVALIFIGPFAWRSGWAFLHGSSSTYVSHLLTNRLLLGDLAIEAVLLAVFLLFLRYRGWTGADFKIHIGGWSTLQAFLLAILMGLGNTVTVIGTLGVVYALQSQYTTFVSFIMANSPHLDPHSIHLGWTVLLGAMVLNAFFEELTCIGYVFNQLAAKAGPIAALLLTTLLRMSCHTYQGPVHMLGIGAVFLITGAWYWRTRNLWPLIFAHALADSISVGFVKVAFG